MTTRIHGIVFSYNRAMQLDATLRSFYLHCQDAHQIRLTVLYKTNEPRYACQYQILAKDYPQVTFYPEKNFRRDTLQVLMAGVFNPLARLWLRGFSYLINSQHIRVSLLRRAIDRLARNEQRKIASRKYPVAGTSYILFLVDDNIFVRDFSISEVTQALGSVPEALGFSLRLGKNTTYCYSRGAYQRLPSFSQLADRVLGYAWLDADFDFGYPLEVSSSVYRARKIGSLIATLRFHQPNKLEGRLARCSRLFQDTCPRLLCFETSVAFCNPVNMVQQIVLNRAGESAAFTVRELAERFEHGERIDVKSLSGFVPNGCHQEVEISFRRDN